MVVVEKTTNSREGNEKLIILIENKRVATGDLFILGEPEKLPSDLFYKY